MFHLNRIWVAFSQKAFVIGYDGSKIWEQPLQHGHDWNNLNSKVSDVNIFEDSHLIVVHSRIDIPDIWLVSYRVDYSPNGDFSGLQKVFEKEIKGQYRAMMAYQQHPTVPSNLNCTVKNCSEMCINLGGKATCVCKDGYKYIESNNTCVENLAPSFNQTSIVYTLPGQVCYRTLENQDSWIFNNPYGMLDYCTGFGFAPNIGKKSFF